MTALEKRLRRKYTRNGMDGAWLDVGKQHFQFAYSALSRKEISWFRDMMAHALAHIIKEETK